MIYLAIYCFIFLIASSVAQIDNSTTCFAEIDNSTTCDIPALNLIQAKIYLNISREITDSIGSENKKIVKRVPNIHPPGQWPGVDFDKKPRYEESAPFTVGQVINGVQVVELVQVTTYRYDTIMSAQIGPYTFS